MGGYLGSPLARAQIGLLAVVLGVQQLLSSTLGVDRGAKRWGFCFVLGRESAALGENWLGFVRPQTKKALFASGRETSGCVAHLR